MNIKKPAFTDDEATGASEAIIPPESELPPVTRVRLWLPAGVLSALLSAVTSFLAEVVRIVVEVPAVKAVELLLAPARIQQLSATVVTVRTRFAPPVAVFELLASGKDD